jgi:hypothetical protein
MKSETINLYKPWIATARKGQVTFVDEVYHLAEEHYNAGGDTIVECFSPEEILTEFTTFQQVRDFCGVKVEAELNAREGNDSDPEVKRYSNFQEWAKERI